MSAENSDSLSWSALLRKIQIQETPSTILLHNLQQEILKTKAYYLASEIILRTSPEAKHKILKRLHPDIYEFFPGGKGQIHSIDLAREIKKEIWIKPYEASHKVYIIQEADRMPLAAISAFLKILEEPPIHAVLILTTTKLQCLPSTVLSRSLTIFIEGGEAFSPNEEIIEYLKCYALGNLPLTKVAQIVKGGAEEEKYLLRNKVKHLLEVLLYLYRDRYMLNLGCKASELTYPQYIEISLQLPLLSLEKVLATIENAYQALENSSSAGSILEWVALQLISLKNQALQKKS
ncbi:DNA polymerase III subunit delta' [Chlamydia sp. 17-3921]|uniref:DNA polymerase III subunit delta' n=1 Tax=Chlamydia sp. 17-3921 TaxID=2675798 RepID=UPI001918863A|nr:DNA polymerase III subunit delta' [Chlamydia sp. 17-3921]